MLTFYFRFRFLRLHNHRHVILHQPTKFRPNRIIRDRVITSSIFQDGSHCIAILLRVSVFVISLISEGQNLNAYQILAKYLYSRLRYYYFRFLKTNVRHVGILLPKFYFLYFTFLCKLGEVENECTLHIFGSFPIFLPKIIKIGANLTKF